MALPVALLFLPTGVRTIAWVGLQGIIENAPRKLHIVQLVIAAPGVSVGAGTILWLAAQGS